jgi:putative copper export protein
MELWELVRFLHVLALALFVGGQLMPLSRSCRCPERTDVMLAVARRFGMASAVAIAVPLGTGIAMASHFSR